MRIISLQLNLPKYDHKIPETPQDEFRDDALLRLLKGERFSECDSIIVYCTRRDECVRLATLIRTKLQVNIMTACIVRRDLTSFKQGYNLQC